MSQDKKPLRRDGFTFKRFFVAHDRCAMKVGIDGMLLGSWAPVSDVKRILDIGTGSGLIALMLAQRTGNEVTLDAVELDEAAAAQAAENAQNSPWPDRIRVFHQDIANWQTNRSRHYDLIVSNPPFFTPGVETASVARDNARYTLSLTHDTLLKCAENLITEEGRFAVILPAQAGEEFCLSALQRGWHLRQRTDISGTENRPPNRVLLALSPEPGDCFQDRMFIRDGDNQYSADYLSLTNGFYLFR